MQHWSPVGASRVWFRSCDDTYRPQYDRRRQRPPSVIRAPAADRDDRPRRDYHHYDHRNRSHYNSYERTHRADHNQTECYDRRSHSPRPRRVPPSKQDHTRDAAHRAPTAPRPAPSSSVRQLPPEHPLICELQELTDARWTRKLQWIRVARRLGSDWDTPDSPDRRRFRNEEEQADRQLRDLAVMIALEERGLLAADPVFGHGCGAERRAPPPAPPMVSGGRKTGRPGCEVWTEAKADREIEAWMQAVGGKEAELPEPEVPLFIGDSDSGDGLSAGASDRGVRGSQEGDICEEPLPASPPALRVAKSTVGWTADARRTITNKQVALTRNVMNETTTEMKQQDTADPEVKKCKETKKPAAAAQSMAAPTTKTHAGVGPLGKKRLPGVIKHARKMAQAAKRKQLLTDRVDERVGQAAEATENSGKASPKDPEFNLAEFLRQMNAPSRTIGDATSSKGAKATKTDQPKTNKGQQSHEAAQALEHVNLSELLAAMGGRNQVHAMPGKNEFPGGS